MNQKKQNIRYLTSFLQPFYEIYSKILKSSSPSRASVRQRNKATKVFIARLETRPLLEEVATVFQTSEELGILMDYLLADKGFIWKASFQMRPIDAHWR